MFKVEVERGICRRENSEKRNIKKTAQAHKLWLQREKRSLWDIFGTIDRRVRCVLIESSSIFHSRDRAIRFSQLRGTVMKIVCVFALYFYFPINSWWKLLSFKHKLRRNFVESEKEQEFFMDHSLFLLRTIFNSLKENCFIWNENLLSFISFMNLYYFLMSLWVERKMMTTTSWAMRGKENKTMINIARQFINISYFAHNKIFRLALHHRVVPNNERWDAI